VGTIMTEFWEAAFTDKQLMWGTEPARSAIVASDTFAARGVADVLIPGVGYGRNARPFLDRGMRVTGIEISETAIALGRSQLGLDLTVHHGSVADMPYDRRIYDGIFCYGLLYLLDPGQRAKLVADCYRQLADGGSMIFTVISKQAPMYGRGTRLGDDWYEIMPGVPMYFYDADSVEREFGRHGLLELSLLDEPTHSGGWFPFINVICGKP
jgi:SAM-dependent methyltransferase